MISKQGLIAVPSSDDKQQTKQKLAVQAQLSQLIEDAAQPGFYGRVSIDVFFENGQLVRCNPLRNQTIKLT